MFDMDTPEGRAAWRAWKAPLALFWTFGGDLKPTPAQLDYWSACMGVKSGALPSGRLASWKR